MAVSYHRNTAVSGVALTVAASDAPASVRRTAHFRCDGTADDVEIQAAIDSLGSDGGHVICAAGNYELATTVIVPSNVTLEFLPGNVVTIADAHTIDDDAKAYTLSTIGCAIRNEDTTPANDADTDIHILGVNLDFGAGTGNTTKFALNKHYAGIMLRGVTRGSVRRCRVINVCRELAIVTGHAYGVTAQNCDGVVLEDCHADECGYEGIGIRGGTNIRVIRCSGQDSQVHSFQASSTGVERVENPTHAVFDSCWSDGTETSDDMIFHGRAVDGDSNAIDPLENCQILNSSFASFITLHTQMTGVRISGCTTPYVFLRPSSDATLKNLTITNNFLQRVYFDVQYTCTTSKVQNLIIDGNQFYGSTASKINLHSPYSTNSLVVDGVTITNNVFEKTSAASDVPAVICSIGNVTWTDIRIAGNRYDYSNTYYGVSLQSYSNSGIYSRVSIEGNTGAVSQNLLRLRAVNPGTTFTVNNLAIQGNSVACGAARPVIEITSPVVFNGLRVTNNRFSGQMLMNADGSTFTDAAITDNRFESFDADYRLLQGAPAAATGLVIARNTGKAFQLGTKTGDTSPTTLPICDQIEFDTTGLGAKLEVTLPDGTACGQQAIMRMTNATQNTDVSVTTHVDGAPTVFVFTAVGDHLMLVWNGAAWATLIEALTAA